MAANLLPNETEADLRTQAVVTEADVLRAKQFAERMSQPAPYWDGDNLMPPLSAKVAKALLNAQEPVE